MNATSLGRGYGLARVGAGAGLLLAPRLGARLLGDPGATRTVRLLGVRDLLLGIDALLAPPGSRAWRRAMALGAAADAADAVITARRSRDREPFARIVLLSAITGMATGAWLAVSPPKPTKRPVCADAERGTPASGGEARFLCG